MRVKDVYNLIDRYAPFAIAEEWDNAGFLMGHKDAEVTKILVTLDADFCAMEHAVKEGCNLIISHHPFIFDTEKQITDRSGQGRKILYALENHLNIISAHTNLDSCEGGINDTLAALLGLNVTEKFIPTREGGMLGRIGTHSFASLDQFLSHAASVLNVTPRYRMVNASFKKIAVVSGSGSSCMKDALAAGVDTLVTGDCRYSAYIEAAEIGLNLIDLGHFETEQIIVPVLAEYLRSHALTVTEHIIPTPICTSEA
ncbi:MAG: Nif3-like dinuclear metal center hexameric protein [Clostridia bacterium]|nr:Nif3-like dinuclear metal center hexameric protein [Clostridia bacterium]